MKPLTWVLESDVFPHTHSALREVVLQRGHVVVDWNDSWWTEGFPKNLTPESIVFHGSLGNAALISERLNWVPGAFCNTSAFCCSSWYENARSWLLHANWRILPANEFVSNPTAIAATIGSNDKVFVRPDSPLKPFSGRVVDTATVTLAKLDHGFYYDDEAIQVVVAPVRKVGREWRFIVAQGQVVTGSSYDAPTRSAQVADLDSIPSEFAQQIASSISAPADLYVLDICECDDQLRLLELNPFGGADLYAADPRAIMRALESIALTTS